MFGSIGPFVKVGDIAIRVNFLEVNVSLADSMGSIDEYWNAFLMIEGHYFLNWEYNGWHRTNMVSNG